MPIRAAKLQQTIEMTNKFLSVFLKYFLNDAFMPSRARIYNKVYYIIYVYNLVVFGFQFSSEKLLILVNETIFSSS